MIYPKKKDIIISVIVLIVVVVSYFQSDYYVSKKQEQYLEYMAGAPPNLTSHSSPFGSEEFKLISRIYRRYQKDRELYPPVGLMFISKILHQNIISFYENCKKYPNESFFWEILSENGDCFYSKQTSYEKKLVNLFRNIKLKNEKVIVDIQENTNGIDYSLVVMYLEQKPIRDTYSKGLGDRFNFGDLFMNFDMKGKGLYYSILCKEEDCIFVNISKRLAEKKIIETKDYASHFYCSKESPPNELKYCEIIKKQWPNLKNRILKHIKQ